MTDIKWLQEAIKDLHGCDSRHLGTIRVRETLPGHDQWEGFVEIFFLINRSEAKEAYAWIDKAGTAEANRVIFLGIPPIESLSGAVRAFLSSEAGYLRRKNLCSNVFSDPIVGVAKACFVKDAPPDALKPDAVITIRKGLTYEVRLEDRVNWGCGYSEK